MTRHDALKKIEANLAELPDERVELLAELTEAWSKPTVFSKLDAEDLAFIDAALDELDAGAGVPWDTVKADLEERIAAAKKR